MVTLAHDNPFPSVLLVEGDPEALEANPAAGQRRLAVGADHLLYLVDDAGVATEVGGTGGGDVATDPIWAAAGDLAVATGADAAAALTKGSDGQVLSMVAGAVAWAAPTAYSPPPTFTALATQFQASSTSCAVTVSAPTTGDKLVAIVYATGRGANSITQTNVTWTKRYSGNGNSQYLEVWTGVVSGTGGTTATAAFTGSNSQYVEIFTLNEAAAAFTAAAASATNTAATTALATVALGVLTIGGYYIIATSANSPTSSYMGCSHAYVPLTPTGGLGRSGILRANATRLSYWSLSSSAVSYFTAVVGIS